MNNVQEQYRGLLSSLVHGGAQKEDRTGTGTKSVFGRILRHDMSTGFPLLTTKKYFLNMQLRKYFGYFKDDRILSILMIMALIIGMRTMNGPVEQMERLVRFTVFNGVILMALIRLENWFVKSKKIRPAAGFMLALGTQLTLAIWLCLHAIMVFKYT